MFTSEGRFPVTVKDAYLAEPKFNDSAPFDVCLVVQSEDGQEGFWTSEVSDDYGKGNLSDKRQWEITLMTLEKLGWQNGNDFSKIGELKGVKTIATTKGREYEGKTYYDVKYLGDSSYSPKALSADAIAARMGMFGGNGNNGGSAQFQQSTTGQAVQPDLPKNAPAENPFG